MKKLIEVISLHPGLNVALFTSISFLISFLFFPVLIKILTQWKLFDPSGDHKIHSTFTPSMGGVAIMLGVAITLIIGMPFQELIDFKFFFIGIGLMFIIGLRDDILALSPKQKLYSQFLPVIILVLFTDSVLDSSYGIIKDVAFPAWVALPLSIFCMVIFTNAYNLIDGVDGLAGAIGVFALFCFGVWFYSVGNQPLSLVAFCFGGSLVAFLFFNWEPSRIFMGDTGALMVGLLLSYLAVIFINTNAALPDDHPSHFRASIGTAVCLLIIPIFDTLRVIILRMRKMQSPFRADRNHLHHQFLNLGFSHAKTVFAIAGINIFFILLAWLMKDQPDTLILGLALGFCIIINIILRRLQKPVIGNYGGESTTTGKRN